MGFDIPSFHIDDDSPEGRSVQEIIDREGVSVEEAVRRGLRALQTPGSPQNSRHDPRDIIGLFSSVEDQQAIDGALAEIRESRDVEIRRMRVNLDRESEA